jgi:hypothetical protein
LSASNFLKKKKKNPTQKSPEAQMSPQKKKIKNKKKKKNKKKNEHQIIHIFIKKRKKNIFNVRTKQKENKTIKKETLKKNISKIYN